MNNNDKRHPNVINIAAAPGREMSHGERFACATKLIGRPTGAKGIGCSWYEVPPGKVAFPAHYHCVNEESIYVLEGQGNMRIGTDTFDVGPGDYITFPVGPNHAHQLLNTGNTPLRYLCFSTLHTTDVVGYPDSQKLGVLAAENIETFHTPWVRAIFKNDAQVGYYDGED